ncbi:MAG: Spy/CpxP family protein refolding chaperone, partial [Paramuribaculum sp.]|nr:Spy/CpxP family protein refolding chaperone [Paramuribaculum sp.]
FFLASVLNLSEAQKNEFAPLLTAMDSEMESLSRNVRESEKELTQKGEAATDADYRTVSEAMFELRGKESEVEKNYYKKFSKILTPRQLFKFKSAERNFMKVLMKKRPNVPGPNHNKHNRSKGGNQGNNR